MVQLTLKNISKHLTPNVIDQVFKSKTNSDDVVTSIEVTRGAPAGEGLISAVYRIHVRGNTHEAKFIAKGLVADILIRNTLNCVAFFKREALFFTKILPLLSEYQKSTGAVERIQDYVPVCYGCHLDENDDYILLEDMSEMGCVSSSITPTKRDRNMALKTLAHFHSISMALRLNKPEEFTRIAHELDEFYYNKINKDWYSKYLQKATDIYKAVVDDLEDPKSIYYEKMNNVAKSDVYQQIIELATTWGNHPVINHGDAWIPNFMFSNQKAVTIDFQLLRCASPVLDLSFFVLVCSNLCRNKDDFMEAIKVYHGAVQHYLRDMGIECNKVFTFDMLLDEIKKYGKFGFLAALSTIPLLASERCDVMQTFPVDDSSIKRIPLENLWLLNPIEGEEQKMCVINALHVAVDTGLI